jgi:hypothetical protein
VTELHPESLLRVPLVRQFLNDPAIRIVVRGVDHRWVYNNYLKGSMGGFNPFTSSVFVPAHSLLGDFLEAPERSGRDFNVKDQLVNELFFAVHDYLHIWSFHAIHHLAPELGFGRAPITDANFEDLVFCHLVTEAAATAGVDYWYLSTVDLNTVCDIGTALRALTVSYQEAHLAEYRRFDPELEVQTADFFPTLTAFYCTGDFPGFGPDDVQRSPLLLEWLSHELIYGEKQRVYTRQLIGSLSGRGMRGTDLTQQVSVEGEWKEDLVQRLGELLWRKVKDDELLSFPAPPGDAWSWPASDDPDYGFTNFRRLSSPPAATGRHFFNQLVTSVDFEHASDAFKELVRAADPENLKQMTFLLHAMRGEPLVAVAPDEPLNLMLVN